MFYLPLLKFNIANGIFFNSITSQIYQAITLAVGEIAIRSMILIDEFCDRISITVEIYFAIALYLLRII